jgi:hypothetical protein
MRVYKFGYGKINKMEPKGEMNKESKTTRAR